MFGFFRKWMKRSAGTESAASDRTAAKASGRQGGKTPPVSVDRRLFFRDMFVHAVTHVEKTGREFAQRASSGFDLAAPQTGSAAAAWSASDAMRSPRHPDYSEADMYNFNPPVYGPPWPPPYGPPIPAKLRSQMMSCAGRPVAR
jgi:hypothetical protein